MIIYWLLLIWTLIAGAWYSLRPRYVSVGGSLEKRARFDQVIIGFAPIIFFAGLKGRGIIDSGGYITSFENAQSSLGDMTLESKSIGFDLLEVAFKQFVSSDYHVWIFFLALISCICIMISLYKYSPMFGLSLFIFVASTQFTWLLNGIRQYLVVTILFANVDLIVERKQWKYIVLILIMSTIHVTALVMLPVYYIVQLKPWSKRMWLVITGSCLLSFVIGKIEPVMTFFLQDTAYETTFTEALTYEGTNILRMVVAAIPVVFVILNRKKIKKLDTPVINICINMSILNLCVFIVSTAVGGNLFGRMAQYFTIYELITLPWLISNCFSKLGMQMISLIAMVSYSIWFYYQMVVVWDLPYISDILEIYLN